MIQRLKRSNGRTPRPPRPAEKTGGKDAAFEGRRHPRGGDGDLLDALLPRRLGVSRDGDRRRPRVPGNLQVLPGPLPPQVRDRVDVGGPGGGGEPGRQGREGHRPLGVQDLARELCEKRRTEPRFLHRSRRDGGENGEMDILRGDVHPEPPRAVWNTTSSPTRVAVRSLVPAGSSWP